MFIIQWTVWLIGHSHTQTHGNVFLLTTFVESSYNYKDVRTALLLFTNPGKSKIHSYNYEYILLWWLYIINIPS